MSQFMPITLVGDNLGERHRHLNSLVEQAANNLASFQDIEHAPEQTALDRLFKIDVAIKLKDIDFILKNLKDDDLLYVSRALKCKWLLEQHDVINPKYLEEVLFPEMVMPAITKMKHWLYINLRDPIICQQFYEYYKDTNFNFAVRFLTHCHNDFVVNEFPKVFSKITAAALKILAEKYPELVKIYFDALSTDNKIIEGYSTQFYKNIKHLLKVIPDVVLDITEKYHDLSNSNKFSPSATKYIVRVHKSRLMAKPELYTAHFLHIPTIAQCLSVEECQELVIRLARADYMSAWFSYKIVEPLIKRISPKERAAFKKRVFVEKSIGEHVAEWPYPIPAAPAAKQTDIKNSDVFYDTTFYPISLKYGDFRCMLKKRKYAKWGECKKKPQWCTELEKLFNEFRFVGFEGTLYELKKRLAAAASADRRRDMLLVLVSKTGGRADAVRTLLQVAMRHRNEPVHERAAIVRSLVKRAKVWRLPDDAWETLLEYAHGLGLDGTPPEANCHEGLHAAIMRQFITTSNCEPALRHAFLTHFTTFAEYQPIESERTKICAGLQRILIELALESEPKVAAKHLGQLLDVFEKYNVRFDSSPVVSSITALADCDSKAAIPVLMRLYNARIGRRQLFRQNLAFRHDNAAFLNTLRHDPNAITSEWLFELLIHDKIQADQYFLKLAVYFNEIGGIAEQIRFKIQAAITRKPQVQLARALASLAGSDITSILQEQDANGKVRKKLAAALRANMHRARPSPDAFALGWRKAGLKAIAWRATRCRPTQVTQIAQSMLEERTKRTVRLALMLAQRTDCAADMFETAVRIRPLATLRAALLYYRRFGEKADPRIWDVVKSVLLATDLTCAVGGPCIFKGVQWLPKKIKPDFCAMLYLVLIRSSDLCIKRNAFDKIDPYLRESLTDISDNLLESVLIQLFKYFDMVQPLTCPAVVIRYLMLSKSHNDFEARFNKIGEPFLSKISAFYYNKKEQDHPYLRDYFFGENVKQITDSLKYNHAFFDTKYECCLLVIERVLNWSKTFMPDDIYFADYMKINMTVLYYKAVRQSIQENPEVFKDPTDRMCERVDIVGFTFGSNIAKEVTGLKTKYFDSIIEIFGKNFMEYLSENRISENYQGTYEKAIIKGLLSASVDTEARLAMHTIHRFNEEHKECEDIQKLITAHDSKEMQFLYNFNIL